MKFLRALVLAWLVTVVACATGCQAPLVSHPYAPADAAESTFRVEVSADFMGITVPAWSGTAWIVQTDDTGSQLVTAGHVCRADEGEKLSFVAVDRWGNEHPLALERIHRKYDLCLLGTLEALGPAMELSRVDPEYDDEVMMVGASLGVFGCDSGSTIEECGMAPISRGRYAGGTLVSIPSVHGNSGGAVFTRFGVIGVLVEGYDGFDSLSFIEPENHLRAFLDSI